MPRSDAEFSKQPGRVSDEEAFNLPKSFPRQAGEFATDFIRGLAKGTIGMAGMVGDVQSGMRAAGDFVGDQLGLKPLPPEKKATDIFPTSDTITKGVESITGKFGKPKSEIGKYAESVGEFVPAVAAGPGGLIRKAAQAAGGGIGSEYAGHKVEEYLGPTAGSIARVLGGAAGMGAGGGVASKFKRDTTPTAEMLERASDAAYAQAKVLPLELDKGGMDRLATSIIADLKADSHRDYLSPKTFRAIEELKTPAGANATVSDIDGVRKLLGRAGASHEEKAAANLAKKRIDDYLENIPAGHVVSGDPSQVSQIFREARGNYAPLMRSEQVTEAVEEAQRAAASSGSGANIDNATRQHLKALRNNEKEMRGWSRDEKSMLDRIIQGGPIANTARKIGKFAPTGVVSSLPTIGAFLGGGNLAALGVAGTGIVGKGIGDHLTKMGVRDLDRMLRSRSALNPSGPMSLPMTPEAASLDAIVRSATANNSR